MSIATRVGQSLLSFNWTRKLLYWLILSTGVISELVFLLASIWMSVNSSVHGLILLVMSEQASHNLSLLATASYVALPELILALSVVTVLTHIRAWQETQRRAELAWSVLYGLPTVVFLVLSLLTLYCSVISVDFRLPEVLVGIRALAGFGYAFVSLLHHELSKQTSNHIAETSTIIPVEQPTSIQTYKDRIRLVVLKYHASGSHYTYQEIADEVGSSLQTVRQHMPSLKKELEQIA